MDEVGLDLAHCFLFWVATKLLLERDALLLEASRVELRNPAWARNRRRAASRLFAMAKTITGERGLPWGVQD